MKKTPVAIYGATGLVGQRLILRLTAHPWFQIVEVAASERSVGKSYATAVGQNWLQSQPIPEAVASITVSECSAETNAQLVFSALDAETARILEPALAKNGVMVCTNASAHRMDENIPLLIPEVNGTRIDIIAKQDWSGSIVANTNCAVSGIAMALAPIKSYFGIKNVSVVTLQSVSGAGISGLSTLRIQDNLLPNIPGEGPKIAAELSKVLESNLSTSVQTWRVPVRYGHCFSLNVTTLEPISRVSFLEAVEAFNHESLVLPSSPEHPLIYLHGEDQPQPANLTAYHDMSVLIGGFRSIDAHRFTLQGCVDNLGRGAAGAAVLNAELAHTYLE